jgi:hypothetical protein
MVIIARRPLHLVLVNQPRILEITDLRIIRGHVKEIAPEISVSITDPRMTANEMPAECWQKPSVTVSFNDMGRFIPPRGPIFCNRPIPKIEQVERLRQAGVPVPHTSTYDFGMHLPAADWGDLVILKPQPLQLTSNGQGLYLFRTARLDRRTRDDFPDGHLALKTPMLVQRFIDTGSRFRVYRCLTLFGETMYQALAESPREHPDLASDDAVLEALLPEPPRHETVVHLNKDAGISDFARRMAEAFPTIPILGCDILKEAGTGQLYALEVNAGGNVWHISSPRTKPWRKIDAVVHLVRAFSSFERAAEVLVKITRKHAA